MQVSFNKNQYSAPRLSRVGFCIFFLLSSMVLSTHAFTQTTKASRSKGFITEFGQRYLPEAELVAEVFVDTKYSLGKGVDVVKVKIESSLYNTLPPLLSGKKEHLILAHSDQFKKGTRLLVVLKRFETSSSRMEVIHRLSQMDGNFKSKIKLIKDYVRIEKLPVSQKFKELVITVLKNINDESFWIAKNSLFQLSKIVENGEWKFTKGDVSYLETVGKSFRNDGLKRTISKIGKAMAVKAVDGPSVIDAVDKKKSDKEKDKEKDENSSRKVGGL